MPVPRPEPLPAPRSVPVPAAAGGWLTALGLVLVYLLSDSVLAAGSVYASGREVSCKSGSGRAIAAFPDVCLTPPRNPATPPGVPVPYPSIAKSGDTDGGAKSAGVGDKQVKTKDAQYRDAKGGSSGGADKKGATPRSGSRGKTYFQTFDMDVKAEGKKCIRHLDTVTQNHASAADAVDRIPLQQTASGQPFLVCNNALFATTIISPPPPAFTFVDAPPHEGVIFDYASPHEEELILDGSEGPTPEQIAAAEDKVRDYIRRFPDEGGYEYQQTLGGTADDGSYQIEVQYGTSLLPNFYVARFDIDGNLIGRPEITPEGRVEMTIRGIRLKGEAIVTDTRRDIHGNPYTAKVVLSGGRGYYMFNEQGQAYMGEIYHPETGERMASSWDPRYFPVLADPGEPLVEREFVQLAQTRCPVPCQAVTDVYNAIAAEINLTVQRMNDHAAEHRQDNAPALEAEANYEQAMRAGSKARPREGPEPGTPVATSVTQKNRARYEGLAETLEILQGKLEEARRNLEACTCPGEAPGPAREYALWGEPYGALPDGAGPCLQELAAMDMSGQRGVLANDDSSPIIVTARRNPESLADMVPVACHAVPLATTAAGEVRHRDRKLAIGLFDDLDEPEPGQSAPRPTSWTYSDWAGMDLRTDREPYEGWQVFGADDAALAESAYAMTGEPFLRMDRGALRVSQGEFNALTDQWWLRRVAVAAPAGQPPVATDAPATLVAVIDSGVDLLHPALIGRTWANPGEIPGNGIDDDNNGLIDDINGWNFVSGNNDVRDTNGHGTVVAGIIASGSGSGHTSGIDPGAVIMALKVTNFAGRGNSIDVASAITYAVEHGARVINISLGGEEFSAAEKEAVDYAVTSGVLVVVAAGNQGTDAAAFWPAGVAGAVTVGATGPDDQRADYSNWGEPLDIAAPGTDIVSLRARYTDPMLLGDGDYESGSNVVGDEGRLYRATGTSFAAPMVAGAASRALANDPALTVDDLERMLLNSARDLGIPGPDILTGYGLLQVEAALNADPRFFIESRISGVMAATRDGGTFVQVIGSADADRFAGARLRLGAGESPAAWRDLGLPLDEPVRGQVLAEIDAQLLAGEARWAIQLEVEHADGRSRVSQFDLKLR